MFSIVIPTKDRPKDLAELLLTVLKQSYRPFEVIIVDDSQISSAKEVSDSFRSKFESNGCNLRYVAGSGDGLTASRNLGIAIFHGDVLFFLDDDTILEQSVLNKLARFLRNHPDSMGVQPVILRDTKKINRSSIVEKLENAIYKVLMLSYSDENKLNVRRSGASVFPSAMTKIITAQRLSGCCCYRRKVFYEFSFDTNLKKYGLLEDLDFSYRVHKKYPRSLYVIPCTTIIHKISKEARLPTKTVIYMSTIYWFYIFFKDIFEGSILNLIAFLWALTGNLIAHTGGLIIKRKSKREWWSLIYVFKSYITALNYLRNIIMQDLEFFNETLKRV